MRQHNLLHPNCCDVHSFAIVPPQDGSPCATLSIAFSSAYVTYSGAVYQLVTYADSIYCIRFQKMDRCKIVLVFVFTALAS